MSDSIGKPNGKGEGTGCFLPWSGGIRLSNGQKYMSCPFRKRWRNVDCKKGSKTLKSGAMKGYGRPRLDIIPSFYHEVSFDETRPTCFISRVETRENALTSQIHQDFTSNLKWKFRGSRYCRLDFCGPSLAWKIIFWRTYQRIGEFKKFSNEILKY